MSATNDENRGEILTRREALIVAGKAGLGLATVSQGLWGGFAFSQMKGDHVHLIATPEVTEGPFFVDEELKRSNLAQDVKREGVVRGLPLELAFTVHRITAEGYAPLEGAHVDVWHCDSMGVYSDISNPMNGEDTTGQKWLRGYQVTDQKGDVKFLTIYPGWYPARTPHIHFKVRGHNPNVNQSFEFTSQVFFDEKVTDIVYAHAPYVTRGEREVRNSQDNVFAQHQMDGTMVGSHLMLSLSKTPKGPGLSGRFSLALNI